jgi:hypothetical protein
MKRGRAGREGMKIARWGAAEAHLSRNPETGQSAPAWRALTLLTPYDSFDLSSSLI